MHAGRATIPTVMSTRRLAVAPLVGILMALFTVLALGTGLQRAPDSSAPTAIEQALIEYRCRAAPAAGAPGTDPSQECPDVQLLSLRTAFGRDLSRLSAAERKTIDSACSKMRASRDAYVDCLNGQLVAVSNRRRGTKPAPSAAAAPPPPSESVPSETPAPAVAPASSWAPGVWIGAAVVALSVALGGVLLALKARRGARTCRICGMGVPDSGDLCQKCRHEAAGAVKRAAAERAERQRVPEGERSRPGGHEDVQRQQKVFQEEEARLRQQEQARAEERARREADVRQREEEAARQRRQAADASEEVFDPYTVLGVSRDASRADILAAYQEARLKYDADQVAHLGVELQEHFKTKALAVERAYQQLTG